MEAAKLGFTKVRYAQMLATGARVAISCRTIAILSDAI